MNCNRTGCNEPATCQITIRVPPKGHGFEHCATLKPGLGLCRKHAEEETPAMWLTGDARAILEGMTTGTGRVPPDFDRAEIIIEGMN